MFQVHLIIKTCTKSLKSHTESQRTHKESQNTLTENHKIWILSVQRSHTYTITKHNEAEAAMVIGMLMFNNNDYNLNF